MYGDLVTFWYLERSLRNTSVPRTSFQSATALAGGFALFGLLQHHLDKGGRTGGGYMLNAIMFLFLYIYRTWT